MLTKCTNQVCQFCIIESNFGWPLDNGCLIGIPYYYQGAISFEKIVQQFPATYHKAEFPMLQHGEKCYKG